MFGYALRHPKLPASNEVQNEAGLTPLTLACKLGRASVFREMLELSAREFWRYSNITCSAYPLNALDTLLPDGRTSTCAEHLTFMKRITFSRLLLLPYSLRVFSINVCRLMEAINLFSPIRISPNV